MVCSLPIFLEPTFRCKLCHKTWHKRREVIQHCQEQHFRFSYFCPECKKFLARPTRYGRCTEPRRMVLFHRETGIQGPAAVELFQEYKGRRLPNQWEEDTQYVPPETQAAPLTPPKYIPTVERRMVKRRPSPPRQQNRKRPAVTYPRNNPRAQSPEPARTKRQKTDQAGEDINF